MDAVGLATLHREMQEDVRVMHDAFDLATERFSHAGAMGLESTAHHLCRFYNACEQMALRVAKAFENHIDDDRGWHTALLTRMSLEIEGIRPALIPVDLKPDLQELKGFRHVFVHAYELRLDEGKLRLLIQYADRVNARLDEMIKSFADRAGENVNPDSTS
jgi:hypothetical protein